MKILMLDIETAPNLAAVWGTFKQNVSLEQLLEPGYTLCWAAKWYGEKTVMFDSRHYSSKRTMMRRIHKLLDQADAVCHYNGTKFDIPTLNKEFLLLGMKPPSPAKDIDLLLTARKRFRLASNKLDFVAGELGLGNKTKHKGFSLWLGCMNGVEKDWTVMERYNRRDVVLLEKVYEHLKPWIVHHPNRSVMDDTFCCPKCGSKKYQQRGYSLTSAGKYRRYQCNGCGGWFRLNLREHSQRTKALAA